jgi:predicted DNA-binding transcriptional regulator AlpA
MNSVDPQMSQAPDYDLEDEVWTLNHIAKYLDQKPRALYGLVKEVGFPRPLSNTLRNRRWLKALVLKYLAERSVSRVHDLSAVSLSPEYEPKSIHFKKGVRVA